MIISAVGLLFASTITLLFSRLKELSLTDKDNALSVEENMLLRVDMPMKNVATDIICNVQETILLV